MVFGDAKSISGVKNSLIITMTQKDKMATNPDKNKKTYKIPHQLICSSKYCFKIAKANMFKL